MEFFTIVFFYFFIEFYQHLFWGKFFKETFILIVLSENFTSTAFLNFLEVCHQNFPTSLKDKFER